MIISFIAAATATAKILIAARIVAVVGGACIAAQPIIDEMKRNEAVGSLPQHSDQGEEEAVCGR